MECGFLRVGDNEPYHLQPTKNSKNTARGIIPQKNVGGVTVVNLCTLSGHALYFYQVL